MQRKIVSVHENVFELCIRGRNDTIRNLLLDRRRQMTLPCEAFLFMASRAQLTAEVIRPALDAGRSPFLVPRIHAHGEHTDDHQVLIAEELARRGLAVHADPGDLRADALLRAAGGRVTRRAGAPVLLA